MSVESAKPLRQALIVFAVLLVVGALAPNDLTCLAAQQADEAAAARKERLAQRNRLWNEAKKLEAAGDLDKAAAGVEQVLAIERELLGGDHKELAVTLNYLADLRVQQRSFAAAREARAEALRIRTAVHGAAHWRVIDARRALAEVDLAEKLTLDEHRQLAEARQANGKVLELYRSGQFAAAIPFAQRAVEIHRRVLGVAHPDYAQSLNNLAGLYRATGDYARAEPLYEQDIEIRKRALGETHPDYASSLNKLALLYGATGDYARAEPLCSRALEIRKQALGEAHPDYAQSLNNLAELYRATGDYARAEPLCKQASELYKQVLGEAHPDYATSLNNLALLYGATGDYARAEPLYKQALEIRKQALGEAHPDYAQSLNNLALLFKSMGDYARAEPLYKQALGIRKQALGEAHPDYATSLNNLAALYDSMGDYARAEPLYKQASEIYKQALGEAHPDYAQSLNNLAVLYESMGDYARAEPLYKQASEIYKQALGEAHPDYARSLNNLAALYRAMGDYARAEPLAFQAARVVRDTLEATSFVQSERQQLAMTGNVRHYLDHYLAIASEGEGAAEAGYGEVLAWKGAVSSRQQLLRRLRADQNDPQAAADAAQLQRATAELATLAGRIPNADQRQAQRARLAALSRQIEDLEQSLARSSAAFRRQLDQRRRTPDELTRALPEKAVLVDSLEYWHYVPPPKPGKGTWERRVCAFVLRHGQPVERVNLGPADPIAAAASAWRQRFVGEEDDQVAKRSSNEAASDPADQLRTLVWDKLTSRIEGAELLLVSPDGALARIPWAAFPGAKPGSYLIEDLAIVTVPIPSALPELLAEPPPQPDEPSLFLVGDVDYGAAAGAPAQLAASRSAPRGGSLGMWQELPNTRQEVLAVRDSFEQRFADGRVLPLRKDQATESRVRGSAGQFGYLHLATHGFFAPPELRSALASASVSETGERGELVSRQDVAGFHPGLLSGIVLAGANREPAADSDDGILTALEIAELDLGHVTLATLSACQTGLGETAGGEGLLGIQRAFQTAGARSVVASLWKVRDDAARQLMIDFYENLWAKKLSKVEALRQAQLTMMREGLKRGLVIKDDRPTEGQRVPPYYWAAFVLSGDWR